ncbi:YdeI/OmpD-associated family protein [Secundilactobacillus collinoides]|uniref:YdeI/OmpD-associated family protein n=1 Tax=Secundilactobacillus collinoides TaxID=33960 RepID=UPI001584C766|nr:YdeI/OmpD-associated family protein [Secundilactobacillus collinoides]
MSSAFLSCRADCSTPAGNSAPQRFFEQLTPGYKREWARYIYAPVREATQTSHFEQMLTALNAGAPNWETYQKQQK